ncbi:transposase [Kitasatospora sp. NPDC088264]|uniref:IS701 family transposase n=1 Tax=Kitasatospora sp. NPDC088264 TaxID=3155296 RepID=UPI003444503B
MTVIQKRLPGRTENCQIGVFAAYATSRGHTLVDRELYLPKSWTDDRERCRAARVPDDRVLATKGELARIMILRALASPLPIGWVTADATYGQDSRFRCLLEDVQISYVVAVPKSQQVHGPRIEHLIGQAPTGAWQRLSAGSGAEGERFYDWAAARLPAVWEFDGGEPTRQRWMLARRSIAKPDDRLLPRLRTAGGHRRGPGPCRRLPLEDRGVLPEREERMRPGPVRGPTLRGLVPAHHTRHARPRVPGHHRQPGTRKGGTERDTPDLVDLTPAEIRRLLATEPRHRAPHRSHAMRWSRWRRRHQARARRCHYTRRGHPLAGRGGQDCPTSAPTRPHSPLPGR